MEGDNPEDLASKFLDPSGHPPLPGRKRKTATRFKVKNKPRTGGVSTLESMFKDAESSAGHSASGESSKGEDRPPTPPTSDAPTAQESGSAQSGAEISLPFRTVSSSRTTGVSTTEQSTTTTAKEPDIKVKSYSNEARAYHGRYAELSEAHDKGRHDYCRDGCLDLLTEPNLPRYTRVQTLQMVSTLVKPAGAKAFLEEARQMLTDMDASKFQVQLLKEDNDQMLVDLELWRGDRGEGLDDEPSEEWIKDDQQWQETLYQEVQEELESISASPATLSKEPSSLSELMEGIEGPQPPPPTPPPSSPPRRKDTEMSSGHWEELSRRE